MNSKHFLSTLCLIVASIIWGTAFVATNYRNGIYWSTDFTNMRFLIGGIIVLPFAFMKLIKLKILKIKKNLYS